MRWSARWVSSLGQRGGVMRVIRVIASRGCFASEIHVRKSSRLTEKIHTNGWHSCEKKILTIRAIRAIRLICLFRLIGTVFSIFSICERAQHNHQLSSRNFQQARKLRPVCSNGRAEFSFGKKIHFQRWNFLQKCMRVFSPRRIFHQWGKYNFT